MAYTGPLTELQACRVCGEPRFDEQGSAREFYTIPLGPQLQALFRSPEGAQDMRYRAEQTAEILAELEAYEGLPEV